ncbi:uncharacterized protein LOC125027593 [Penaeus chinensis]|uniref:uncharacterized protein LOC125027593 n=1 Tax=Penaeus chinensis TaxID=139456 RepID=UPI001FB753A5|nr:uncharacterized protein LOC125027593 [Penaeus chinensis]
MVLGTWTEALQTDGGYVMAQVTKRLYEGGSLRPDDYYKKVPSLGYGTYKRDFDWNQQQIIESCGRSFDIWNETANFDISLHWILLKNTCGLKPTDNIYKLLKILVKKRNDASHPNDSFDIDVDNINEKLDELLSLYMEILDCLEELCSNDLTAVKRQITLSVKGKKLNRVRSSSCLASPVIRREVVPYNPSRQKESSGLDKGLVIGGGIAVAGAAVLGLASLLSSKSEGQKRERQRASNRTSNDEECVVM